MMRMSAVPASREVFNAKLFRENCDKLYQNVMLWRIHGGKIDPKITAQQVAE